MQDLTVRTDGKNDPSSIVRPFIVRSKVVAVLATFESDVISFRKVDPISRLVAPPTFLPLFSCHLQSLGSLRDPSANFPFINSNFVGRTLSVLALSHLLPSLSPSFFLIFTFFHSSRSFVSLLFFFALCATAVSNGRVK